MMKLNVPFYVISSIIITGVFLGKSLCKTSQKREIICSGKRQWKFDLIDSKLFTCMVLQSEINGKIFVLKTIIDEQVHGIDFSNNSKVQFLPGRLQEKFPNLLVYDAQNCKVRSVDESNFEKLFKLTAVDLSNKFINHIPKDLFKDSVSVQVINLSTVYLFFYRKYEFNFYIFIFQKATR